mmetsp:Transcript_6036/g.9432  ORF Transcript_6036/g.9432 Transcript_6036/m.9432 type:complete len:85 (-) Transcript_6036:1547-1801(-)
MDWFAGIVSGTGGKFERLANDGLQGFGMARSELSKMIEGRLEDVELSWLVQKMGHLCWGVFFYRSVETAFRPSICRWIFKGTDC